MRPVLISIFLAATAVLAQNCGPKYKNKVCAAGSCCSQYGWCDTTAAHCDPATCKPEFSGQGSSCKAKTNGATTLVTSSRTPVTATSSTTSASGSQATFMMQVPHIDVCGKDSDGITCPGAGTNGYFYRCCSSAGHCGPKNDIQDEAMYCGTGCQPGFGNCLLGMAKPPLPVSAPGIAQGGETCGPIVNKKCATGLCCSGSNFCGTGEDFCGADNWCQKNWGHCN
ncbi:hypothetical protein MCOR27_006436 [Pyricularia oryzae]|uniref:Chitin-binding type-1 domain-containing protein n=3 Tax=Pyricularia TaxID=48558 RepID=A0ABQ8NIH7_PYRGI|nr:uncharacterized protein MGG_06771 [Pyricularia oryzae 70-15]KAH8842362.1 hypothetical protein MCOR01_006270 [Pyricularia oryzae]KAI6297193.1 hypothetical protein MCOR33_006394 [Pyricularia grisea]EHA56875.1 hypothetical protein MGG_06771 [Pyricularia oryzae 70-15]KAH9435582.1 hypothetical protein MCOR02_004506 [Pyricularia oryzae]KAI6258906.1 hypothetical protein MCOR19_004748 [Pyricularia oryzae]